MDRKGRRSHTKKDEHDPNGRNDGGDEHGEREEKDDPLVHTEIERARFEGGLPPTAARYAAARKQWRALPGAVPRADVDSGNVPPTADPDDGSQDDKGGAS